MSNMDDIIRDKPKMIYTVVPTPCTLSIPEEKGGMKMKRLLALAIAIFLGAILIAQPQPVLAGELYCTADGMTKTAEGVWTGTIRGGTWDGIDVTGWSIELTVQDVKNAKIHRGTVLLTDLVGGTYSGEFKGRYDKYGDAEGNFAIDENTRGGYKVWFHSDGTIDLQFWPHGFDEYGYNYGANLFVGPYDWYDRDKEAGWEEYHYITLVMKWSDNWWSENKEGSWCTNHMYATEPDGTHWTYFCKIVYSTEPIEGAVGPIWGNYWVIEEVESGTGITTHAKPTGLGA